MTTSVYNYATVADVEGFTGIDYSVLHATKFTAALIEAKITMAERMVNAYLGMDGAVALTDGVKMATIMIASKILHNNVIELGVHSDLEHADEMIDISISSILRMFLKIDVGVDSIPMSGADR